MPTSLRSVVLSRPVARCSFYLAFCGGSGLYGIASLVDERSRGKVVRARVLSRRSRRLGNVRGGIELPRVRATCGRRTGLTRLRTCRRCVDASRAFVPSEFPLYRLRFSKTKDDPAEYNRTTCEIEAFTMTETGPPIAWRTVSSARSWVE